MLPIVITLLPPLLFYIFHLFYSLCRFYDFYAALRGNQKKRKEHHKDHSHCSVRSLRSDEKTAIPSPCISFLLLYIPYIVLTPARRTF